MRSTYRVLAYALAVEVLVQAMAIAYGMAGLGKWVEDDHGVLNKKVADGSSLPFRGGGGFALHGVNGMLIIPILVLLLLIVSLFAKIEGGRKQAAILFGLVLLQVILGIALHGVPYVAPLHALNAFAILVVAYQTGKRAGGSAELPASAAVA
ncbi:MAG: hypothetical protein JWP11_1065 [Frankiales bacterium]|nr:hypothetical protein [Frankiales bacterium]